jgi:hypothetical protein
MPGELTTSRLAVGVYLMVVTALALWVPLWYWLGDGRGR